MRKGHEHRPVKTIQIDTGWLVKNMDWSGSMYHLRKLEK